MSLPQPYCTRSQAADWLGVSVDTVDRMLVPMADQRPASGNLLKKREYPPLRCRKMWGGQIRIVTADVLSELPEPTNAECGTRNAESHRQPALCV